MISSPIPIQTEDVASHYDELSDFYLELWGEHLHHGFWRTGENLEPQAAAERLLDWLIENGPILPGDQICDVGCGYGATFRYLKERIGVSGSAYTLSSVQHRHARMRDPEGIHNYHLGDWLQNDLPSASVDVVLSVESLSHMSDRERFFSEAHRVLKPGGRLILCDWLAAEQPQPWQRRYLLEPICREGRLPALNTSREYLDMLHQAGFMGVRHEDLSRSVQRTWWISCQQLFSRGLRNARLLRYVLRAQSRNRDFIFSPLRLWFAYRTRAFEYGFFRAERGS